jgi:hypothetical protein
MLLFLAADKARLEELRDAARAFLAWSSVVDDHVELNLDPQQQRFATTQRQHFDETVTQRIGETFIWLLTPRQEAGKPEVTWEQQRVTGQEPIPVRVSRKLKLDEGLIIEYSGTRLRMDLDRVPLWQGDHIGLSELWSYYAQYLYLPRLRDRTVLAAAVQAGVASTTWEQDAFAYAEAWDEQAGTYRGLVAGSVPSVVVDRSAVAVKPEAARRQLDATTERETEGDDDQDGAGTGDGTGGGTGTETATVTGVRRFYGVKSLDPQRVSRDADQVATEIVRHLVALVDANVDVKIEIAAEVGSSVPDHVIRTVTENARTLKFDQHGFEQE